MGNVPNKRCGEMVSSKIALIFFNTMEMEDTVALLASFLLKINGAGIRSARQCRIQFIISCSLATRDLLRLLSSKILLLFLQRYS